jgi:hypothetical protein
MQVKRTALNVLLMQKATDQKGFQVACGVNFR